MQNSYNAHRISYNVQKNYVHERSVPYKKHLWKRFSGLPENDEISKTQVITTLTNNKSLLIKMK